MATIGWIDALRRYNLGGTAWCIPRKGTAGYEAVMRIRKGEQMKTPKELIADLEAKTSKPKVEKRSMTISLSEPSPKPKRQTVKDTVAKD